MKLFIPLVIVLAFGALFGQTKIDKDLKAKYDKFKDRTNVESSYRVLKRSKGSASPVQVIGIQGLYSYPGERLTEAPETFFIRFMAGPACRRSWCFDREHDLRIMTDGKPLAIAEPAGNWDSSSDAIKEYVTYSLTRAEMAELVKASKIELQIGTFETTLSDKDRDLLARMYRLGTVTN